MMPVQAHTLRPAIIDIVFDNTAQVKIQIETNLEALLAGIGPEHDNTEDAPQADVYRQLRQLPPQKLKNKFQAFQNEYKKGLLLSLSGQLADWQLVSIDVPAVGDTRLSRNSVVRFQADIPPMAEQMQWSYAPEYGDAVVNFSFNSTGNKTSLWLVQGEQSPVYPLNEGGIQRPWAEVAWDYTQLGFVHILPKGLDHILFVLGLFLLSTRFGPLLWQVTAFTVAHSITLALSIYGYINLSATIVEPLIALSIAYVGIENIVTKELKPWRLLIVFIFGLLHGMGFAGVLTALGLPENEFVTALITFNVGVELGQISVILLAFFAVFWIRKQKNIYRKTIVIPGSIAIAAMGLYWTWERVMIL
ncbi:MAG: HupE/UreJ family protein [Gammaproteobacteria bacterium]|nr:HupE/UreJ family protein [Gammaproteobacteria bacterium]